MLLSHVGCNDRVFFNFFLTMMVIFVRLRSYTDSCSLENISWFSWLDGDNGGSPFGFCGISRVTLSPSQMAQTTGSQLFILAELVDADHTP
jgi:hypothetical protein